MSQTYFPRLVQDIGEAGVQLTQLESTEGSAGNISVFARDLRNLDEKFTLRGEEELPIKVPDIAGGWVVVTGTGRRLRDVRKDPEQNLVVVQINKTGERANFYAATDLRPTSEWNSHLAIHADQVRRRDLEYLAIVHAQPHYLTFLSHQPAYNTTDRINNRLMRWEPETILTFPEGIGLVPFYVPGSARLMEETVQSLQSLRMVVWQKHGVVARSDVSASKAADLVEYAEMAAKYEVLNLGTGSKASGLTDDELKEICVEFKVPIPAFLKN